MVDLQYFHELVTFYLSKTVSCGLLAYITSPVLPAVLASRVPSVCSPANCSPAYTWPMPSLSRQSKRRRHENIFPESSYATQLRVQTM